MLQSRTYRRGLSDPFAVWNTALEFVTDGLYFVPVAMLYSINVQALECGVSASYIATH